MEDDTWSFAFSASSSPRSYQSHLKSISDLCNDYEEIEEEDDFYAEYPCPFCDEDFDLVDLCSHIYDEHDLDDEPGVCPVCATRVGIDMVTHITMHHSYIFDRLQKRKQKDESRSTSFLKKELEDECYPPQHSGSSSVVSSSKMEPDPLLSFLLNVPPAVMSETVQSDCSTEEILEEKSSDEKIPERDAQPSTLTDEEHKERAKRSEFVQGLLLSIMLDDIL